MCLDQTGYVRYLVNGSAAMSLSVRCIGLISPCVTPSSSTATRRTSHTDFLTAVSLVATNTVVEESR